ncbi:MAG: hypothetical protein K0R57_5695 [Paenibacillaceae bacterium]|jgi:hypothetical protein|nr:hypothetical protein [Paenibacillaceae bacterium]
MNGDKPSKKPVVKETQGFYDRPERFEIIGGIRYDFLSSPKYVHQKVLTNFYLAFHTACCLDGETLLAPMDVHFDEENIVQPDVIYIARENRGIIRDGFVFGVPDLLVEILSRSTGSRDKTIKKAMYERFGVREYWLADPEYRVVEQYVLTEGRYLQAAVLAEHDRLQAATVPCLTMELSAIFPEEE